MQESISIQKNPTLPPANDYHFLRKKGLEFIEQLGSRLWTDYNLHDPGITILEALCFAITDLGYRTDLEIKDLLATPGPAVPDPQRQAFFTAREVLTMNPWTTDDFRKLLIDLNGVKNAWLFCNTGKNVLPIYGNCVKSILQYEETDHAINLRGLYDVLIEFEDDESSGNLNSGKVKYNFNFLSGLKYTTANIEIRLPSFYKIETEKEKYKEFRNPLSEIIQVQVSFISGNKLDNVDIPQNALGNSLRRPLYATIEVEFKTDKNDPATSILIFEDVPLIVRFSSFADRKNLLLADLKTAIMDSGAAGIFAKYLEKIKKADVVMDLVNDHLHQHRNLCEDYQNIQAVQVQDMGVCADLEVDSSVDIEEVLAEAYYLIDQYLSPDLKFYSLLELLDMGRTVDEIFEGPVLQNGFLDNEQLKATNLRQVVYASDIINLLMDIPGVVSIKNFMLTTYNEEGILVQSDSWQLAVEDNFQARLYVEGTKFLVFKNGLPFLPDRGELNDTFQVIRGQHSQPKFPGIENDLLVPTGNYYDQEAYYPVQYSLPITYGVGFEGLPSSATVKRIAQAKQLKSYLLFFEQLLVNYLSQLAHLPDLFALDTTITQTYFTRFITEDLIKGLEDTSTDKGIYKNIDAATLWEMVETENVFHDRRNRFLDHLLARFGEQFNDYALMLHSYLDDKSLASEELIKDKISFLKSFPFMSANRVRSFNYKDPYLVCESGNIAGLQERIERLLGFDEVWNYFELYEEKDTDGKLFERRWRLKDEQGKIYLSSSTKYYDESLAVAEGKAKAEIEEVKKYITDPDHFDIQLHKKWVLNLLDDKGEVIATRKEAFKTEADALAARDKIIAFAEKILFAEKIFIVEHLLLRPRNGESAELPAGDPLLSVCLSPECDGCCEEDPYSFRLTIVMNGEEGLANKGIEFRRFAEKTIRLETPAHLGLKICWISKRQLRLFERIYCDWLMEVSKKVPEFLILSNKLHRLICMMNHLKSVYPPASLHDCQNGNDENRVYLNNTII